ncbi:metalloprotease [Coemansia sp. RSA 638]|nr:metalloprotease [Coemansia sp. RSA 638]
MQHSLFFKALFAIVALGLYNFYSSKWSPPSYSSSWSAGFAERQTASNLTYYVFDGPLEQSVGDTRQHQLIKLPNNMVVLCTSDPNSVDTAASLSVNVGSMADPKEFPGMAHFLEHMLFMGSAKYPAENEYTQYIANNLGEYNAYTANTETTFYFSIAKQAFEGALDRFSRFFIDPLLLANSVDREVNAVDSEYKGNLQSDVFYEEFDAVWRAGMGLKIDLSESQLKIKVTGFNDKLVHLLTNVLHKIQTFTVEQNVYDSIMTEIKQALENVKFKQPIRQLVGEKSDQLNMVPFVPTSSLEQLLDQVTIDGVQKHIETVFSAAYFKMLMVGNFEQTEAVDAAQQVSQMLKSQPLPTFSHVPSRIVNIEPGHYIYRHMGKDTNMLNNAVVATFYCGMVTNPKDRTTMTLLSQIAKDQFFDQLRTKEQLGYIVGASTNSFSSGKITLNMMVQGESNPTYLLQRIDRFVHEFRQTLAEFDTVKFDALVESIAGKANEKVTSVDAEANRMWIPIDKGTYDFALLADEVESLQKVRLDDVLDMWDRYINPETAVAYTRVDGQMWAAKTGYPSASDMATWPENILALAGCLESETHMPVDLSDLSRFVHTAVTQSNTDTIASLARLYPIANSTQVLNESAPGWSKIKNALDMAMYPRASHMLPDSVTNFAHIGMYQTVEGKWVITNVDKFKATQALFGLAVPVTKLIPNTTAF